jgi:hypothetical protein
MPGRLTKTKFEPDKIATWEEAKAALANYEAAQCRIDAAEAARQKAIFDAQAAFARAAADAELHQFRLSEALKKFAQAHKTEFRAVAEGGEGRTRKVGQVVMGFEWGPPFIHIPKKFEQAAIAWLEETAGDTYVKRTPKIMREVISAELQKAEETHDQGLIDKFAGQHITREQDELFVLKIEK